MAPIFFAYERTPLGLKKMHIGLSAFNTYLERSNTEYAAGSEPAIIPILKLERVRIKCCNYIILFTDDLTIADFPLVTATMCLEAINFSLSSWIFVDRWYNNFKLKHTDLWEIAKGGMEEISYFEKNPPDLSHMDHPIHPVRK